MHNAETDLFGEEIKTINIGGYAAMPGTGPDGKFCRDCKWYFRNVRSAKKAYLKCNLVNWTNGSATDIKASAKACYRFKEK